MKKYFFKTREGYYQLNLPLRFRDVLLYFLVLFLLWILWTLLKIFWNRSYFSLQKIQYQPAFRSFSNLSSSSSSSASGGTSKKTVMVTGGASGIGAAYVFFLLLNEFRVVIVDKNETLMKKQITEWKTKLPNAQVLGIPCDITDGAAYAKAFHDASAFAIDHVLDAIILNAGILSPLFSKSQEQIMTNLWAPMYGTELYVRQITEDLKHKAQKDTQIIITGSLANFIPIDVNLAPIYDATKIGIGQFVRSCRPIARRFGFRINAICPSGMVDTPLNAQHLKNIWDYMQNESYLILEGRGGIMKPTDMIDALMIVMMTPTYNGDIIAVNPNLGYTARLEPLDEGGAFSEYGNYSEMNSVMTSSLIDYRIQNEFPSLPLWTN